jgi:hypothetical protein
MYSRRNKKKDTNDKRGANTKKGTNTKRDTKKGKYKGRKELKYLGWIYCNIPSPDMKSLGLKSGGGDDNIYSLFQSLWDMFIGFLYHPSTSKGWEAIKLFVLTISDNILWVLNKIILSIGSMFNEITSNGLNSKCLRVILYIFAVLASFGVSGQLLTISGVVNVFGDGGLVSGWMTTFDNASWFSVIWSIIVLLGESLWWLGSNILGILFSGPVFISSLVYSILISIAIIFISTILLNFINPVNDDVKNKSNIKIKKKGGGKPLKDKLKKLSLKKLLSSFNSISNESMLKIKEEYPSQFLIAVLMGFIKETDNEYKFTEQGVKALKSIIIDSVNMVDKHCKKDCNNEYNVTSKKRGNNIIKKRKGNRSEKATEELSQDDVIELKDILLSMDFINKASFHGIARESSLEPNTQDNDNKKKGRNLKKSIGCVLKEDIEWLKEKYPEQYNSAKNNGFINENSQISDMGKNVFGEYDVINGISISKTFDQPISSQ